MDAEGGRSRPLRILRMRFDIFTIFPDMFAGPLDESIIKRAQDAGLVDVHLHDIREYATDKHSMTDDTPYGGGGGMVMKPEPVFRAVEQVLDMREQTADQAVDSPCPIILLTPQGRPFTQDVAQQLSEHDRLALICGRYEGVDERVREHLATDEISVGPYVLSGGELPAMIIVDAVTRLIPGVLGDPRGAEKDSYAMGLLEHPHYTRPNDFRGWNVPDVLLSGHHGRVDEWRRLEALMRTLARQPDLLSVPTLTEDDLKLLDAIRDHLVALLDDD